MRFIIMGLFCLLLSIQAHAESTLRQCIQDHHLCTSECLNIDGDGSQAACVAKCAGLEAQCAGAIGIQKSEPMIRKKAQELENLLQDFFGDILPEKEPVKKPSISTDDGTNT